MLVNLEEECQESSGFTRFRAECRTSGWSKALKSEVCLGGRVCVGTCVDTHTRTVGTSMAREQRMSRGITAGLDGRSSEGGKPMSGCGVK